MISAKSLPSVLAVVVHHRITSMMMVVLYSIVMHWQWQDELSYSETFVSFEHFENWIHRYFYGELHQLADGCSPLRNIFYLPQTGKVQLQTNVSIHLVLSDAPNGDAREYLPSDANSYLNAYDTVKHFFFSVNWKSISILRSKWECEHMHQSMKRMIKVGWDTNTSKALKRS